ncbi:MAG: YkgJ family cysteine cluster protein [Pseudomonadota bacterium]
MSRADRRRAASKAGGGPAGDVAGLAARVAAAKLPGTPPALADRARRALGAYLAEATGAGMPFAEVVARLADGRAALAVAKAERRPLPVGAACASGCAFCCILSGDDGGLITEAEARALHAALSPKAGTPDGREWHPSACPALDPGARTCRAYDARPEICRAFHSMDASACEANARGEPVPGARLAGGHLSYLAAHGLARAALKGRTRVDTYALREIARCAVEGQDMDTSLSTARHAQTDLDAERRRTGRALSGR